MRFLSLTKVLLAAALALACGSAFAAGPAIVILPLENLSESDDAPAEARALLATALTERGWTVVEEGRVEALLEEHRVRYVDSLEGPVRETILREAGATAYLAGSIYAWNGGRTPRAELSARIVRAAGTVAWADVTGLTAADTERLFGFGRASTMESIAAEAIRRLVGTMPDASEEAPLPKVASRPWFRTAPASYRSADLDPAIPNLVCILPLDNQSGSPEGARVVGEILALRFAAAPGFEVVDAARLRSAALKARVGTLYSASNAALAKLAPLVGTPLFLRGTVYRYVDGGPGSASDPRVQLELSLVDVVAGRVVWSSQHERAGSDYLGFLMMGASSNAVQLADRAISEMIDAEPDSVRVPGSSWAAARLRQKRVPARVSELGRPEKTAARPEKDGSE